MQIRRTTTVQNTNAVNLQTRNKTTGAQSGGAQLPVDQLDISTEAQLMQSTGNVRADRVANIRAEIANGQYETSEKINSAVERMLDEFA